MAPSFCRGGYTAMSGNDPGIAGSRIFFWSPFRQCYPMHTTLRTAPYDLFDRTNFEETTVFYYYLPACYKDMEETRTNLMALQQELNLKRETLRDAIQQMLAGFNVNAVVADSGSGGFVAQNFSELFCKIVDITKTDIAGPIATAGVIAVALLAMYARISWGYVMMTLTGIVMLFSAEQIYDTVAGDILGAEALQCSAAGDGGGSFTPSRFNEAVKALRARFQGDIAPVLKSIEAQYRSLEACDRFVLDYNNSQYLNMVTQGASEGRVKPQEGVGQIYPMPTKKPRLNKRSLEALADFHIEARSDWETFTSIQTDHPNAIMPRIAQLGVDACYKMQSKKDTECRVDAGNNFDDVLRIFNSEHPFDPRQKLAPYPPFVRDGYTPGQTFCKDDSIQCYGGNGPDIPVVNDDLCPQPKENGTCDTIVTADGGAVTDCQWGTRKRSFDWCVYCIPSPPSCYLDPPANVCPGSDTSPLGSGTTTGTTTSTSGTTATTSTSTTTSTSGSTSGGGRGPIMIEQSYTFKRTLGQVGAANGSTTTTTETEEEETTPAVTRPHSNCPTSDGSGLPSGECCMNDQDSAGNTYLAHGRMYKVMQPGCSECTNFPQCCGILRQPVLPSNALLFRLDRDNYKPLQFNDPNNIKGNRKYDIRQRSGYPHQIDSTQGWPLHNLMLPYKYMRAMWYGKGTNLNEATGMNTYLDKVAFRFGDNFYDIHKFSPGFYYSFPININQLSPKDGVGELGVQPYMNWWEEGQPHCEGCRDSLVSLGSPMGQQCNYGGWEELKLYQMRCWTNFGLHCLCNYEKTFKQGSAEQYVLDRAGFMGTERNSSPERNVSINTSKHWPLSWRGYVSDPETPLSTRGPLGTENRRFPYAGGLYGVVEKALVTENSSPYNVKPTGGISNAIAGDILVYDVDVIQKKLFPPDSASGGPYEKAKYYRLKRLPHVAYVEFAHTIAQCINDKTITTAEISLNEADPNAYYRFQGATSADVSDCYNIENEYVIVSEQNFGKFPDMCGNTDRWNMPTRRTIYKNLDISFASNNEGWVPPPDILEFNPDMTCADPALSRCKEELWTAVKVYDPRLDVRRPEEPGGAFPGRLVSHDTPSRNAGIAPDKCWDYTAKTYIESQQNFDWALKCQGEKACFEVDMEQGCDPPIRWRDIRLNAPGISSTLLPNSKTSRINSIGATMIESEATVTGNRKLYDPKRKFAYDGSIEINPCNSGTSYETGINLGQPSVGTAGAGTTGCGGGGGSGSAGGAGGDTSTPPEDQCPQDTKHDPLSSVWPNIGTSCSFNYQNDTSTSYTVEDILSGTIPTSIPTASNPIDSSPLPPPVCSSPNPDVCNDPPYCFWRLPDIQRCDASGYERLISDTKNPFYTPDRSNPAYRNVGYSNDFVADYLYYKLGFFGGTPTGANLTRMRYLLEKTPIEWISDLTGSSCWMLGQSYCGTTGDTTDRVVWLAPKTGSTWGAYDVNDSAFDNIVVNQTIAVIVSDSYYRGQSGVVVGIDRTKRCVDIVSSNWKRNSCQQYDAKNCYQLQGSFGVPCRARCVPIDQIALMFNPVPNKSDKPDELPACQMPPRR